MGACAWQGDGSTRDGRRRRWCRIEYSRPERAADTGAQAGGGGAHAGEGGWLLDQNASGAEPRRHGGANGWGRGALDGEQIQRSGSLSPSHDAAAGDDRIRLFRESLRPGAGYDVFGGGRRNTGNERLPPMLRWPRGKLDKRHASPKLRPKPAAPKMVGLPTHEAAPARSAPLAADAVPAERECSSGVALALPRTRSQDAPPMTVRTGSDRSDQVDALVRDRPPVRFTRRTVSDFNGGNGPSPDPPLVRGGTSSAPQAGRKAPRAVALAPRAASRGTVELR